MAVPKRRVSHSRKKLRQSHQALTVPAMARDKATKSWHRPHHVDLRTGLYRGKQVLFKDDQAEPGSDPQAPQA
ncbi:50S ribosomal protein L32 [Planctomycetota bacterium]|nr:50S ribosomal protein L32 [Planctomycetota bacterium]